MFIAILGLLAILAIIFDTLYTSELLSIYTGPNRVFRENNRYLVRLAKLFRVR